jgi:hypothetical protein
MNRTKILAIVFPALFLAACENPLVQDILRVPATVTAIHIHAETLDGGEYKPAGEIAYGLNPAFSPEHRDYTALVPENTDRVSISAAPRKEAVVRYQEEGGPENGSGQFGFTGKNSALIHVTVEEEFLDTRVYAIRIRRKQPAWLEDLRVTSDITGAAAQPLSPGFSADSLGYTVVVPSTASKIRVEGTLRAGVELAFKQADGSFAPDPPFRADETNRDFSSGDIDFTGDSVSVSLRVFLPSPPNPDSDPKPLEYTLLVMRPGRVDAFAGQESYFILGESAADSHYYKEGEVAAFTVTPPFGYAVARVWYMPEGGEAVTINPSGNVYAFVMPGGNVGLKGEWARFPPVAGVLYVRGLGDGETAEQVGAEKNALREAHETLEDMHDGSSWARASLDLQGVMDSAGAAGKEIWVSGGKLTPDWSGVTPGNGWAAGITAAQHADKRNWSFILKKGAHIYGGFGGTETAATAEAGRGLRNPGLHETILSGNLGAEGNAAHVLVAVGIDQASLVEGLTISGGSCVSGPPTITVSGKTISGTNGGGVYTVSCGRNLKFLNVTITGNAAGSGGGMYNHQSGPTIEGAAIRGNTATSGGGMYNEGTDCSPLLSGWTSLSGNQAFYGGGMYNRNASPVLRKARVNNNSVDNGTGGIWNLNCNFEGEDVEISGNTSFRSTGGMTNWNTHVSLKNARITGNKAAGTDSSAGGIHNLPPTDSYDKYYITLTNVEISGNSNTSTKPESAGGIYAEAVYLSLNNVTISGNKAAGGAWGILHYYKQSRQLAAHNSIIWGNGAANQNTMYYGIGPDPVAFKNTLVERPAADGGNGIVTGAYNAAPSEPFSGSAGDIFAGPLPSSSAPVAAPLGAYQLKSGSVAIDKGNTSLYGQIYGLPNVNPGDSASTPPPTSPGPAADFAENARPQGVIDLGAYEKH